MIKSGQLILEANGIPLVATDLKRACRERPNSQFSRTCTGARKFENFVMDAFLNVRANIPAKVCSLNRDRLEIHCKSKQNEGKQSFEDISFDSFEPPDSTTSGDTRAVTSSRNLQSQQTANKKRVTLVGRKKRVSWDSFWQRETRIRLTSI